MKKYIFISVALLFFACASQKSMFQKAQMTNTIEAYEQFLEKYPEGEYTFQAKSNIEKLSFKNAESKNTIESYNKYLSIYPEGEFTSQAKSSIENLIFTDAKNKNTIESYKDYLLKYPEGKYSSKAESNIEKLVFQETKNKNTLEAYQEYLSKYPNGKYTDDANSQLSRLEFEKSLQDYEEYFKSHSKSQNKTKIKRIRNGILTELNQTAENHIKLSKEKKDFMELAHCYVNAADAFNKIAQIEKIIGYDEKKSYEKAAYLYYLASSRCQMHEMQALSARTNAMIANLTGKRKSNVATTKAVPKLDMRQLYIKAAELYKKAGQEGTAEWMMEGGKIKHFGNKELAKELNL